MSTNCFISSGGMAAAIASCAAKAGTHCRGGQRRPRQDAGAGDYLTAGATTGTYLHTPL